jgi:hypothetical protein
MEQPAKVPCTSGAGRSIRARLRLRNRVSVDGVARSLAGLSLTLWTGVVLAGRWLGLI